jgi:Xaa-Pro aminopeptidase
MTRLSALRSLMTHHRLSIYIVPSDDPHMSEYVSPCFQRRHHLTGFKGSAGTAVVALNDARLWTDGRYYIQAELELESGWKLMKSQEPSTPSISSWILSLFPSSSSSSSSSPSPSPSPSSSSSSSSSSGSGSLSSAEDIFVGIDPLCCSYDYARNLEIAFSGSRVKLMPVSENLVDAVWGVDRPLFPAGPVNPHLIRFSGVSVESKLASIREKMRSAKVDYFVVTALHEIAWLLNIRGSDVPCTPVVLSYCVVGLDSVSLFVDEKKHAAIKSNKDFEINLPQNGVVLHDYHAASASISSLTGRVWVDASTCNYGLISLLQKRSPAVSFYSHVSPIVMMMAIKNPVEIQGFRDCHLHDAVALVSFFSWLNEQQMANKLQTFNEHTAAEKLASFRQQQPNYIGPSFETISAVGPHGAIVHYRPSETDSSPLTPNTLYLLDSGGQYLTGTTDVTRTLCLSPQATAEQRRAYTLVLKGHIAIDSQIFPEGINGHQLDILARTALWQYQLDYSHGTGHGVGSYLCVHEGPHGISKVCDFFSFFFIYFFFSYLFEFIAHCDVLGWTRGSDAHPAPAWNDSDQ